ncbi:MAG: IclR family transcriptional regulator [Actinobacteria bacterium]|nr:IclR family transcriptional regulator [Actinomycetota bacterium]MBI3686720.1 IclR family transcriptional regulator [Actinomycetota bacterium]
MTKAAAVVCGPSVAARVLAVLSSFDETHTALTLSDIARRSKLPLSTTHRLLAELERWQAVDRAEDGAYHIGRRLWQLGTLAPVQRELREVALPAMQDLFVATQENVTLAVLSGTSALYVERIHGKASVPVESRPGRPLPLHATGVGKVLLAHAQPGLVDACLSKLTKVTSFTIVDRERMCCELAAVRRNGYARSFEEMTPGVAAIAVPIFDPEGRVLAALGLVTRILRKDLVKFVPALRVAAATISRNVSHHRAG